MSQNNHNQPRPFEIKPRRMAFDTDAPMNKYTFKEPLNNSVPALDYRKVLNHEAGLQA